jgi:hypothetical protein
MWLVLLPLVNTLAEQAALATLCPENARGWVKAWDVRWVSLAAADDRAATSSAR